MKIAHKVMQLVLDKLYRSLNDQLEVSTLIDSGWKELSVLLSYLCDIFEGETGLLCNIVS